MTDSLNDENLDPGEGEALDLLMGPDGDVAFINGDLVLVRGTQASAQEAKMRCRSRLGEWFLDVTFGVNPDRVFTKPADVASAQSEFRKQILATTGVESVNATQAAFIARERRATLSYSATLRSGATLADNINLEG